VNAKEATEAEGYELAKRKVEQEDFGHRRIS